MWFKQIQLYELSSPLAYQPEELAAALENFTLIPCLPSLPLSLGWVSPFEKEEAPLVMGADGYMLICLGISEKILPATVVRQKLIEEIKTIESKENRRVGQRQRQALKDEVVQNLLPKAFINTKTLFACIDTRHHWLWLATTSAKQSEQFLLAWQKVLPAIGLVRPELNKVSSTLTHWMQHFSQPKPFTLEKNFVLQDIRQQSRIIRCQQQALSAPGIQSLLKEGCEVRQLALKWHDRIEFVIDDELQLRSVKFSDELISQAKDAVDDSPEIKLATDFTLLTANLTELYQDLLACFGKKKEQTSNNHLAKEEFKSTILSV